MSETQQPQYESFPPKPSDEIQFKSGEESGPRLAIALGLLAVFAVVYIVMYVYWIFTA